ncbi:MAG TPA: type II toxin-antitoxin system VapC family toxin [Candidatus Sulfotelmatobacter sp.]|nr:type II toxin-antitoxin system VapC family toxin [Candidatus Sulfotelmatobacter sp.]
MSARRYVLDANALVGLFEDREGTAARVERLLQEGQRQNVPLLMSTVNWGEVFYIVWRRYGEDKAREAGANVLEMPIVFVATDFDRATRAAALKQKHNLSYADAFAAELAIDSGAWLVTADPEFPKLGKVLSLYQLPRHARP